MDRIERLRQERAALLDRVRIIDGAISDYEAWESRVETLLSDEYKRTDVSVCGARAAMPSPDTDDAETSRPAKPTPMAIFMDAVRSSLSEAARPLGRADLLQVLEDCGIVVGGADAKNTLSARLSRMPDVINLKGFGYWMASRPFDEAGYGTNEIEQHTMLEEHRAEAERLADEDRQKTHDILD